MEEPTTGVGEPGTAHPDDDSAALVARLRKSAIRALVVLSVGTAVVTRDVWSVLGVLLSGALMIVNFELLERVIGRAFEQAGDQLPGPGQVAFLAFRLVLLGLVLCGIVLIPGIGPIPVALGLSVLVLAALQEAFIQLLSGGSSV